MENDDQTESPATHIDKLIANAVRAGICFGVAVLVLNIGDLIPNWPHAHDHWVALVISVPFIGFWIYFAIVACWHAMLGVLWPILLMLELVGSEAAKSASKAASETVKEVDEGGGVRGIVHRIWYGKQGPPE